MVLIDRIGLTMNGKKYDSFCATHGYVWFRAKWRSLVIPEQNPKVTGGTPRRKDSVLKKVTALNSMFLHPSTSNQDLQASMDIFGSVQFPAKAAIMPCKAHQNRQTPGNIRNQVADTTAREVAGQSILLPVLSKVVNLSKSVRAHHDENIQLAKSLMSDLVVKCGG